MDLYWISSAILQWISEIPENIFYHTHSQFHLVITILWFTHVNFVHLAILHKCLIDSHRRRVELKINGYPLNIYCISLKSNEYPTELQ